MNSDSGFISVEPPALEVVQFELLLGICDLVVQGFEAACRVAAEQLDGRILFNHRLDDDPAFQRVAAVAVGPQDEVALVFLDHAGAAMHVEDARLSGHELAPAARQAAAHSMHGRL